MLPSGRWRVRPMRHLRARAILIYVGTIVLPVCVLVWLGLQSFNRQSEALRQLELERFRAALDDELLSEAARAFDDAEHPLVRYRFVIERGVVLEPALYGPLPDSTPAALIDAERLLASGRPAEALRAYRTVAARHPYQSLPLHGIARSLERLGQVDDARAVWLQLADKHPDARTLSHRPFGVVAAINAGRTDGLAEQIAAGRWHLPVDQSEFFLARLGVQDDSPLWDRVHFANLLHRQGLPSVPTDEGDIAGYQLGAWSLYYRRAGVGRLEGFATDTGWIERELSPRVAAAIGVGDSSDRGALVYGSAVGLVLLVLSAGVLLILRDVSREARTSELRADFVSGVSHELKTPITLVRLYGETLLRHHDLPEEERRESLRVIARESARLGRLADQVLAFSRIERGAETYDWQVGDITPVVVGVADDYGSWLERNGFELERDVPAALPDVRFDAGALAQAVLNLIDNAVKYSGHSRWIGLRLATEGDRVLVEVRDRGVGIAEAEQERIFDRFYRSSKGSGKGGYGLGLYMVAHIVRAHGGRVDVRSAVGEGSTFTIVLPTAET